MCELRITWVGVSDGRMRVVGRTEGDDCAGGVEVTLHLRYADGTTAEVQSRPASWLDAQTWEALFALNAEERAQVCRVGRVLAGGEIYVEVPGYLVEATCEACGEEPARHSERLECCPRVELLPGEAEPVCVDPDCSGVLRRGLRLRWRVTRGNVEGPIDTRAFLRWGAGAQARGADRTLPDSADPAHSQEFSDVLIVPPETDLRFAVELARPNSFCGGSEDVLIPALPPCDCEGHEPSSTPFKVTDENGTDITEAVAAGDCVSATRVTVTAPDDVRGGCFEWLPPAVADQGDRFSTTAEVPDTDEGVTVTARVGSAPCAYEPSVNVRRCQSRPAFCRNFRMDCRSVEICGVLLFYACLCLLFDGLGIVGGASAKGVLSKFLATLAEKLTAGMSAVPEPVATKVAAVVAAVVSFYGEFSTGLAAWASTAGLFLIWVALVMLVVSLLLLTYWINCCAPRDWHCRFLINLHWSIRLFLATQWAWALVLSVVCLIFDIGNIFTVVGIGFAAIFSYIVAGLVGPLVEYVALRRGCNPTWLWEPPFLR